jgi:ferrous iron transport protein B
MANCCPSPLEQEFAMHRREGRFQGAPADLPLTVLDFPGTYGLNLKPLDEQIARDVLFQRPPDVPTPSVVVEVADASKLARNFYFSSQVIELGYPTIICLNLVDVAEKFGHRVDVGVLDHVLGSSGCSDGP